MPGWVKLVWLFHLLRDMDKQKSKSTLFHLLTEDLNEFEGQLLTFMRNSKKMISFADLKPFTMQDAAKKGIKDFSFTAPVASNDNMALLKYLTTHDTYLYAKLDKDLDIEVPIDGGPMKFTFSKKVDRCVSVGERIFYNEYENTIEDGRNIVKIADVMTLNMPLDVKDKRKPEVKMTTKAKFLSNAIQEAEFAIAIYDTGKLTIGDLELEMKVNEPEYINELRERLKALKELQEVLDKLHVSKPFDLFGITDDQSRLIDILISTVGKGETVNLPNQESTLFVMEISNVVRCQTKVHNCKCSYLCCNIILLFSEILLLIEFCFIVSLIFLIFSPCPKYTSLGVRLSNDS